MNFNVVFDKAFKDGIRKDDRQQTNADSLVECYNLAATEYGLRPFRKVVQPITDAALTTALVTKAHPWPQLIRGKSVTLLCDEDAIFTVTESPTGNWTVTLLTVYDWTTYDWDTDAASAFTITAGDDWHFVDMEGAWMLFNGACVLFKTGLSSKVFGQDDVTINTGALYQDGRLFLGGFDTTDVGALADLSSLDLSSNWVWWGTIGLADMLRFFSLDYMKFLSPPLPNETGFTEDAPFHRTLAKRRESHATPMPFTGAVNRMMQLGEHMIVYGATGTHALSPLNTNEVRTFGRREIAGLGTRIAAKSGDKVRAFVGGDETVHGMVDEAGDFWIITPDLQAENLGYRHIFAASGTDNVVVQYDPHEQEFYFTAANQRGYRLRRGGMTTTQQLPTSIYFGRSNSVSAPIGIFDSVASNMAWFETEWFNGDTGSESTQKKVPQVLRTVIEGSSGWQTKIYFERYPGDSERVSQAKACDRRNVTEHNVSGTRFKVYGVHQDKDAASISRLTVEMDDGARREITKFNAAVAS